MESIKLKFKGKIIYPFLLLFFPIIIDCINGYFRGSTGEGESLWGVLYRGAIVILSLLYLFRNTMSKYISGIFIAMLFCQLYQIYMGYFYLSEISSSIKTLYIFCVLSILLSKHCSNIRYVVNCAIGYGVAAALILIFSYIFKTGYSSYTDDTFGSKGFFIAMNDIGLTILLLNALSCFFYLKTKEIKYFLSMLIMAMGASLVGSMACYFGTLIVFICFVLNIVVFKFKDFKSSKKYKIITLLVMFVFMNIIVWQVLDTIVNDSYLSNKYSDIGKTFTEISGRDYLIDASQKVLKDYSLLDWLFGTGLRYNISIQHVLHWSDPKSVEVDPLDLIGNYGIIFSVALIWFSLRIFFKIVKCMYMERVLLSYWLSIGFILYIGHAIYGGHAYTSPLVSSCLAVFIYLFIKRKKVTDL